MSGKKILLIGFILVLLIAIPVTVFLVQQQQRIKIKAVAATTLSLLPPSSTVTQGDKVTLRVNVIPGNNQVSFVKFTIDYDSSKLKVVDNSFKVLPVKESDGTTFPPSLLQGPTYTDGVISATISVGSNIQYVIENPTEIASVDFDTSNLTDSTTVSIDKDKMKTQVLSIGSTDQFNENVLLDTTPATITVNGKPVTETPTNTPAPTTVVTTITPTATPTPTTQQTSGPSCSSLSVSPSTSGTAPFTVNLTANGQSSNSAISKITFSFGDGQTQDVTDAAGIGTNSVAILQSHIYNNPGNYTATAVLTDASGNVSPVGNCSVAIAVNNGTTGTTTTTTTTEVVVTATPTPITVVESNPIAPTGPSDLITIGSLGAIVTIIGAVLLLAL